jgi:outer membrane lipopolysaccharide assembly protein LptE/RlpB
MGRLLLIVTSCAILFSCGYQFQGRHNPLKELGVERIYVAQFRNRTYRPGIEQLFSTAMVREIRKSGSFRLVDSEADADAVLEGTVIRADATISSTKSQSISTEKVVDVAAEYNSAVSVSVQLRDKSGKVIFSRTAGSNKIFPGATSLGDRGATVPLVNESEQRLAIQFLAAEMMAGVYQRMIDTF